MTIDQFRRLTAAVSIGVAIGCGLIIAAAAAYTIYVVLTP